MSSPTQAQLSSSGSPPMKRQRTNSSSPDMRKLLGKTLEHNLEKMEIQKINPSIVSEDVFSVSLDEIDEINFLAEEGKSMSGSEAEFENKSPTTNTITKTDNSPKLGTEAALAVQWVEVSRTSRKSRFYRIEAFDDEEGFEAVHNSSDHTKIPAGLNGKKPFMVVPGIEYGLEYEAGEECSEDVADDKEMKMIKNEKYLLDSFVCDVGYLSDDELNETPTHSPSESRVRRLRRANNIKEKKKIELLGEPEVCGPFWRTGSRGCKKEVKKWETIVLSDLPIPTTFSSPHISVLMGEDPATEEVKDAASVSVAPDDQVAAAAPVVAVEEEDYETKYHIKYTVKFLVERRMRGQGGSPQGPRICSTPMMRRPVFLSNNQVSVSKEDLLVTVSQYPDIILANNPEMVKKYVSKYHNKFSYL